MPGILIVFHTPANTGYALEPLEKAFFQAACNVTHDPQQVHFAFLETGETPPRALPEDFNNVIALDLYSTDKASHDAAHRYIEEHNIECVFAFDAPVRTPMYKTMRKAGVRKIISYWGAAMSQRNHFLKLWIKKCEVALSLHAPDLYIFESEAMRMLAINGRGIPRKKTEVIFLGVDTDKYQPQALDAAKTNVISEQFGIDPSKKIAYFSGHMEERKGVHIIIKAAIELIDQRKNEDWHFLIFGNRNGEEQKFLDMLAGTKALECVTFGGYRKDLPQITPHCHVGIIASTGWDSFTMSSLEISACGLPLVVSRLQGLQETVIDKETGFLFEPGDYAGLANILEKLAEDEPARIALGQRGRQRIMERFKTEHQQNNISHCIKKVLTG